MYLRVLPKNRYGKSLLVFSKSYREQGKVKKKTVEKIGYLEDLQGDGPGQYADPIAHFRQVAEERTLEETALEAKTVLTYGTFAPIPRGETLRKNIGYLPLNQLYEQLGLSRFMANRQRNLKIEYSLNAVSKLLIYSRTLFPASKKKTYEQKDRYFEKLDFSLDDVYRSLSLLDRYADDLKKHLHQAVSEHYGRRTDLVFYDVTNYYFEIDTPDPLRRKGVSKEHRPNPIVQMGLLMDAKGLPVTYELFSGNTNDCETLMPVLQKVRQDYAIERFIVVADRGLNSSNNIAMTLAKGDGYIYGQSILKASAELKAFCLDEQGYQSFASTESGFKIKSRVVPKTIRVVNAAGQTVPVSIDEKQVLFYSHKYAERSRAMRQEVIEKAQRLMASPKQSTLLSSYGALKYVKGLEVDPRTGEVIQTGTQYYLNEEKIAEEAKYDGYYAVVTSELDMPDTDVMDHYRGLWKIEESFRLSKSELEARPVYVSREEHINAHFLTCFIALLLTRLVQLRTNHQYPAGQLLEAMRNMSGTKMPDQNYIFDYYSPVVESLKLGFNTDFDRQFLNKSEINKMKKPR